MVASPINADHARLARDAKACYFNHGFWIHESGQWSHQPWDLSDAEINDDNWDGFADEYGFDEADDTLKTMFFNAITASIAYYNNLIALDPNWSPIGEADDVAANQVTAVAEGSDDPSNA